jgi:hypothetical protein
MAFDIKDLYDGHAARANLLAVNSASSRETSLL